MSGKDVFDKGDAPSVQREAHKLKGAAANVGALALQGAENQIEISGEAGDLAKASTLSEQLDKQFEALQKSTQPDF